MGLVPGLLLTAALCGTGRVPAGSDWPQVWGILQQAQGGEARLETVFELLSDLPAGLRAQVARYHHALLIGEEPSWVACAILPELAPGGAWAFALAINRGPALDEALCLGLAQAPDRLLEPLLERGYREFLAHSEAARAVPALALAEALHARALAVWSAQNLAIARTRSGAYTGAASVLQEQLEGQLNLPDRALMASRLSIVQLGEGGLLNARRALGRGLLRGGSDSAIVLGLLALEGGDADRSRRLYRSVLSRDPEQPWAQRGWGLSMVPR